MSIVENYLTHGIAAFDPKRVIVHSMAEYVGGIYAPDFLDSRGLSAHALVTPDLDVIRCRRDDQGAYHAGSPENGPYKGQHFNATSFGIEILVPGNHTYGSFVNTIKTDWCSEDAMQVAARVVSEWMARYDIPLDNVLRHSDIDPYRKVDPGEGFRWDDFRRMLWTPPQAG